MKNTMKKAFFKHEIIDLDAMRDVVAMATILSGIFMLYLNVVAVRLSTFAA